MDIASLQAMITNDIASNRTPLFVIGDVGASICGQIDNVKQLQDTCSGNNVWLHLRGHSLAALAITQGSMQLPNGQMIEPIADSMSLNLGSWLGLPNLPVVVRVIIHKYSGSFCTKSHTIFSIISAALSTNRKCCVECHRRGSGSIEASDFIVAVDEPADTRP